MSWKEVTRRWWYWYPKEPEDLLQVVQTAVETLQFDTDAYFIESKQEEYVDIDSVLSQLGIPRTASVDLIHFSLRARKFLEAEGLSQIGSLLEYLDSRRKHGLPVRKNFGWYTTKELLTVFGAVSSGQPDRVRMHLPLCHRGRGLCFSAAAANLLNTQTEENRTRLFQYLHEGATLHEVGVRCGRTRARIEQVVSAFLQGIRQALGHFPEERQKLWSAWEKGESLEHLLDDELDGPRKQIVSGAIRRLFAGSFEGKTVVRGRL
jgi:hypothetical protein